MGRDLGASPTLVHYIFCPQIPFRSGLSRIQIIVEMGKGLFLLGIPVTSRCINLVAEIVFYRLIFGYRVENNTGPSVWLLRQSIYDFPEVHFRSEDAGKLGLLFHELLEGKIVEERKGPRRQVAISVLSLLCRAAGNPTALKKVVSEQDAAKLAAIFGRVRWEGNGTKTFSSLCAATWLIQCIASSELRSLEVKLPVKRQRKESVRRESWKRRSRQKNIKACHKAEKPRDATSFQSFVAAEVR